MTDNQKEQRWFEAACFEGATIEDGVKAGQIAPQRVPFLLWHPGTLCRGCGQPVSRADFAIWITYWKSMWAPCHKACREAGMRREIIECQTIDADCNDCRHFQRGKVVGHRADGIFEGRCLKFDKPVRAFVNFCSGHPCFEHRRTAEN